MNPLLPIEQTAPVARGRKSGSRLFTLILAVVALFAFAALVFRLAPRHVKPIELARSDLVLRNGRLYPANGSNAFTGVMIEQFPGGLAKSRSAVHEGRMHGLSEG